MQEHQNKRLSAAQAETVLRRAAELNASRLRGGRTRPISPEALVEAADHAGIPKEQSRRALSELAGGRVVENRNLPYKLYGPSCVKLERELGVPPWLARERLEHGLCVEQGLKLRRSTDLGSLWVQATFWVWYVGRWTSLGTGRSSRLAAWSSSWTNGLEVAG